MELFKCPMCNRNDLVEISERIVRDTDIILCSNEYYLHLKRGHTHLLVRPTVVQEEKEEPQLQIA